MRRIRAHCPSGCIGATLLRGGLDLQLTPKSPTENIMRRIAYLVVCGSLVGTLGHAHAQPAPQARPCAEEMQKTGGCNSQAPAMPPRPSAEEIRKSMDAAMGSMVPMMGRMTEVAIEAQLKIAARPETAEIIATFKKNLFDQLQKKGFSAEQALQITLSTTIPSAAPGK
jgi:hypothetical protein